MWQYYVLTGYVLIGLYLIRMLIIAKQGISFKNLFSKFTSRTDNFELWVYIIFYFLFATSLLTGFRVVNGPKESKEIMGDTCQIALLYVSVYNPAFRCFIYCGFRRGARNYIQDHQRDRDEGYLKSLLPLTWVIGNLNEFLDSIFKAILMIWVEH